MSIVLVILNILLFSFVYLLAPSDKVNFNVRLSLVSTHSFVKCGSFMDLTYLERSLSIKVDPTGLPTGIHTAQ